MSKIIKIAGFTKASNRDRQNLKRLIHNFLGNIIKNASISSSNRKAHTVTEKDIKNSLSVFGINVCKKQSGGYIVNNFKFYDSV